ncbi:MAG: diguanylate cyclase/phosphodiesterase (GGDEF & EAL domains) with PAS/PAC sensor(s) [uncultured Solirubrobacteraceae bacterium]|uniref:Diguanylate cyclase/phosphodiesterase (GGDEF & EAL domains) with PAS/PAC sensor(S) n=1 Tax=uncultured Solirubrobacteraceae bacterium TaxID=1162706 RepID=A0A6J4RW09_9ACTN|nr:MAG: diguanylate cyclase/phosphodiesterase (GGDEF & EAL domains) with PAS/PAC sensor(s) [uncultured Solirubrobacteraceae bacterium]
MGARWFTPLSRGVRFAGRHPFAFGLGLVLAVVLSAGLQLLERREETAGERRYIARADLAATFVSSYVADLRFEQRTEAREYLRSGTPADDDFARLVRANRFASAVLLDSAGRVSAAHPLAPGLIGRRLTGRYWHLQRALGGRPTVSNVVPSAADGFPAIAIATPVRTAVGRGVFSTAYKLSDSPLTAFLASAMPMAEDDSYLVDANGVIVASKQSERGETQLGTRDAPLAAAVSGSSSGIFTDGGEKRFYVVRNVVGTPWRLVSTRPLVAVRPTWYGGRTWMSAALSVGLGAAVLIICALFTGLLETRTRLLRDVARREQVEAELVRERSLLAHQATHDALTGLPNRALLFAHMDRAYAHAARDPQRRAAVLFIDLDGFKPINDSHGHQVGDLVLTAVADRLRSVVRPSDTVARIGGDEFAILCDPLTVSRRADVIAERVRVALEQPIAIDDELTVRVGASVGVAERVIEAGDPKRLLAEADAAMYAAKVQRHGRRRRINSGAGV